MHLTALPDREVAALLVARPDLAAPPSSSFLALATRAGAPGSIEHALAGLDAPTLAVAEAVVALNRPDGSGEDNGVGSTEAAEHGRADGAGGASGEPAGGAPLGEPASDPAGHPANPDSADGAASVDLAGLVAAHLPLPAEQVTEALGHLRRLALVVEGRPLAALEAAFGPHPFGLGPWAAEPVSAEQLPPTLEELSENSASGAGGGKPVIPAASVEMLQALTWGPPAGTLRAGGTAPGAAPLIERGWLERSSDAHGRTRFILPRQVALALRGGRLTRETLTAPEAGDLETVGGDVVASESSFHAEETVRLVAALLEEWGREGGTIRRTGGVSVRALTRTADALDLELHEAARIIEIAADAGLLGLDDDGATWVPSTLAAGWLADSLPQRWAPLALAWAGSARTSWLTGTRDDDGTLRAALGPDLEAGWAVRLRARVLALLGDLSQGTSATPAFVRAALTWESPRRTIPGGAISAVLAEAETLGITGGGALTEAGRILARRAAVSLDERDVVRSGGGGDAGGAEVTDGDAHAEPLSDDETLAALEAALAADLPAAVDMILVQSDLTAIVPGRPAPELAALLERTSVVESRGGALTVRFTPESVRGALDVGYRAEEITQAIGRYSPAPLPDSLSVLIQDAARHHGAVRVRAVSALLRVGDEATAAGLLAEPRLKDLGLDEVAPGILVATASAGQVLRELRATGLAPVTEDASGHLVVGPATAQQAHRAPEPTHPGSEHSVRRRRPGRRELATLVGRLRVGQEALQAAGEAAVATDPVHALAVLRQAQSSRSRLRLTLAGPDGAVQERQVRVMAVEPGRVRLRDVVRETELTVAVHRIVSVEAN